MSNKKEIGEAKSLRWLSNQFPFTTNAKNDIDRMGNCIHLYCRAGADKIEELNQTVIELTKEVMRLKDKYEGLE